MLFTTLDNLIAQKRVPVTIADLDRQRQRRRAGQPARPRVRHDVRPLRAVRRVRSAAAGGEAVQRQADQRSECPGHDGLQLGRFRRVGDGLVSHRSVPPRADLLRHVRQSAVALQPGDAGRRVGISPDPDSEQPRETDPHLDARQRPGQLQRERRHARLGAGQSAHGQGHWPARATSTSSSSRAMRATAIAA